MAPATTDSRLPQWVSGLLLVGVTVALAGIGDSLLSDAGYPVVGAFFWVVCYAGALFVVWFVWLRHIDLSGPTEG
jgi:hypothetical protein